MSDRTLDNGFAAVDREARLLRKVSSRMVSDFLLGAFLSGGIDSSLIVALLQAASTRLVKTFRAAFQEADYHEANHARAVANTGGATTRSCRSHRAKPSPSFPVWPAPPRSPPC